MTLHDIEFHSNATHLLLSHIQTENPTLTQRCVGDTILGFN